MRLISLYLCSCSLVLAKFEPCRAGPSEPKPLATFSVKPDGAVRCDIQWMDFIPAGHLLAVRYSVPGSKSANLGVYDVTTGRLVVGATIKDGGRVRFAECGVSPRGDWVVYGEDRSLRFLAIPPHKPELPRGGSIDLPNLVLAGHARVWVDEKGAAAFVGRDITGSLKLEKWDLTDRGHHVVLRASDVSSDVYTATLNVSAGRFALSTNPVIGGKLALECWTLGDKPVKTTIALRFRAESLALSPDGKMVAVGYGDGTVAWYDTATGKPIRHVPPFARFTIGSVAFHPGGKYLACGAFDKGGPNLFLIDSTSGEILHKLAADPNGVTAVCFSPTGDRLAAFGASGTVTIWDATKLLKLERD